MEQSELASVIYLSSDIEHTIPHAKTNFIESDNSVEASLVGTAFVSDADLSSPASPTSTAAWGWPDLEEWLRRGKLFAPSIDKDKEISVKYTLLIDDLDALELLAPNPRVCRQLLFRCVTAATFSAPTLGSGSEINEPLDAVVAFGRISDLPAGSDGCLLAPSLSEYCRYR